MKKKTVFVITNTDFYTNNVTELFQTTTIKWVHKYTDLHICNEEENSNRHH